MDSLPSVSPSMVLPPSHPFRRLPPRLLSARSRRRRHVSISCTLAGDGTDDDLDRALHMDGAIPGTSNEFVKRVSSRAYDMRRNLQQSFDSSSYDGTTRTFSFLFLHNHRYCFFLYAVIETYFNHKS